MTCPTCELPLEGLGTFCWNCHEYVSAMTETEQPKKRLPDSRTEDERKRDARPTIEQLGWTVWDVEQGYRPDTCRSCGTRYPGGHSTRVPKGFPDWVVAGFGVVAFIEWKAEGKQSDAQKAFGDACDAAGVPYRVVRSTEDAVDFLERQKPRGRVA